MKNIMALKDHLLEIAFLGLLLRSIFLGAGIGDALVFVSLVISMAYTKYLNRNIENQKEELNKKVDDLTAKVQSLYIDRGMSRKVINEQKAGRSF